MANFIGAKCVQASKLDRAGSFFEKADEAFKRFKNTEVKESKVFSALEVFNVLPEVPYTHLSFNYGNYFMALKQHEPAASHFYDVIEKSPFRFCP